MNILGGLVRRATAWLRHQCKFENGNTHCSDAYCSNGKFIEDGWKCMLDGRWAKRPETGPVNVTPPVDVELSRDLSELLTKRILQMTATEINDLLVKAYERTVPPPPPLPKPPEAVVNCTCFSINCSHRLNPNHWTNRYSADVTPKFTPKFPPGRD